MGVPVIGARRVYRVMPLADWTENIEALIFVVVATTKSHYLFNQRIYCDVYHRP